MIYNIKAINLFLINYKVSYYIVIYERGLMIDD